MKTLRARKLYTPYGPLRDQRIVFEQKIEAILPAESAEGIAAEDLGCADIVCPGFIDLHIHGIDGADATDGTKEALRKMAAALPCCGCTSFLATTVTEKPQVLTAALEQIRDVMDEQKTAVSGAQILGVHLEGPFLSPRKPGAQSRELCLRPTADNRRFLEPFWDLLKIITVAPETDADFAAVREWREQGIVCSMGHTACDYDLARRAYANGVTHVTHTYNAMTGLQHRAPGALGAALTLPMTCELIADGHHVQPAAVQILLRTKGVDKIALITDAIRPTLTEQKTTLVAGQEVTVQDGKATLSDGTLAGSVLTLDRALRNLLKWTSLSLSEVLTMLTLTPARILGVDQQKGQLIQGADADFVAMDDEGFVERTFVRGREFTA